MTIYNVKSLGIAESHEYINMIENEAPEEAVQAGQDVSPLSRNRCKREHFLNKIEREEKDIRY